MSSKYPANQRRLQRSVVSSFILTASEDHYVC